MSMVGYRYRITYVGVLPNRVPQKIFPKNFPPYTPSYISQKSLP